MEIYLVGAFLFYSDGWRDTTKLTVMSCNFQMGLKTQHEGQNIVSCLVHKYIYSAAQKF